MDPAAAGIPSPSPYKKQKLSSSSSITSIEDLKDGDLVEILVRLPLECVFRCKCVSKYWLALLSDPCFIRSYIKRREKLPQRDHFILFHVYASWQSTLDVYGHLPVPQFTCYPSYDDDDQYHQYPISDPSGIYFDFSFNFIPFKLKPEPFRCFEIVRISHGLVLCNKQVRPPGFSPSDARYYICNPLTKQWLNIPSPGDYYCPRRRRGFNVGQVGFMCYARDPHLPHEVEFIVLEVQCKDSEEDDSFCTCIFSSHTGSWSNYHVACPPGSTWLLGSRISYNYGMVVVYQGMFHWSGSSCLIAYDPLNEPYNCKSIPSPKKKEEYDYSRVELSEGYIRMAYLVSEGTYSVFQLSDYDNGKWDLKYAVRIPYYMQYSFCSQTNGNIMCVKKCCYTRRMLEFVNMKSGSILSDLDIPQYPNLTCEPFAANFFVMTAWPTKIPQLPNISNPS